MEKHLRITVTEEYESMTIGQYLRMLLKLSPARIRGLKYRDGGIQKNGCRARVTEELHTGDILELQLEDAGKHSGHLVLTEGKIRILYEDGDVIAVWKKSGRVVHPAGGHYGDSLANDVYSYLVKRGEQVQIRSIGRLDKDTSGVVVFAKNRVAAARLWEQKEQGIFVKEYLALCEGAFSGEEFEHEHTIDAPIGKAGNGCGEDREEKPAEGREKDREKDREEGRKENLAESRQENREKDRTEAGDSAEEDFGRYRMCVTADGKEAVTRYQALRDEPDVMQVFPEAAEEAYRKGMLTPVRLRLKTGRTHQIRVHMSHIGHPLFGDPLYGHGIYGKDAAALCARSAEFLQPFTGEKITAGVFRSEDLPDFS